MYCTTLRIGVNVICAVPSRHHHHHHHGDSLQLFAARCNLFILTDVSWSSN